MDLCRRYLSTLLFRLNSKLDLVSNQKKKYSSAINFCAKKNWTMSTMQAPHNSLLLRLNSQFSRKIKNRKKTLKNYHLTFLRAITFCVQKKIGVAAIAEKL